MNVKIDELVDRIQYCHLKLGEFYSTQKDNFHDQRIVALLDFVRRSEKYQVSFIESLKQHIDRNKRSLTIKLSDKASKIIQFIPDISRFDQPSVEYSDIMRFCLSNDVNLVEICKEIYNNQEYKEVEGIFSDLCKMTCKEMKNLYSYTNLFAS